MTAHQLWERIPLKIVILGTGIVIAFVQLQAQVQRVEESKADKREVAEMRAAMATMARDVRVLRLIACRQARADSFCDRQP